MLDKLSLKMKLIVGFGLLLAILVALGVASYRTIVSIDEAANEVDLKTTGRELAVALESGAMKESSGTRGFMLTGEEKMLERDEQGKRELTDAMGKLATLLRSEEAKRSYAEIQRVNEAYRVVVDREIQLRREGKTKEALEVMSTQEAPAFDALDKTLAGFTDLMAESKQQVDKAQDADVARGKIVILSLAIAGIALGFVVATMIVRSITGSISRMLTVIQEIANKNLTTEDMKITSEDEIGKAGLALNQMKNSLHEVIQSIAETAQHV